MKSFPVGKARLARVTPWILARLKSNVKIVVDMFFPGGYDPIKIKGKPRPARQKTAGASIRKGRLGRNELKLMTPKISG